MSILNRFSTGGGSNDGLTANSSVVMDGYKFVGASTDDVETSFLQLIGDAVKNHVTKGTTFYTVDPKIH